MLFNSLEFFLFFPCVTALYYALPHRFRWALLLSASCLFYMAFIPAYILILAVTIVVDYFAGIMIEQAEGAARKRLLWISIVSNIGFLFFFKYFNFANENISALAAFLGWNYPIGALRIILPIGLSFHTFQALSYTIEVYRGHQRAERHFGIYALYVMFYPQLVAGPIERPQNLLHQFREPHEFNYDRVVGGLRLMLWGLFKKMVIADRLAIGVDEVFKQPGQYSGLGLAIATVSFAIQIYCDFSGYSEIAVGAAQVMGFRLMENFRRPYLASSLSGFWSRWHISLSTWFKDYVYISLGGNRVSVPRWCRNLLIVFVLSGLWHGAAWTFVAWGALHGFCLIFERAGEHLWSRTGWEVRPRVLSRVAGTLVTFCVVCAGWVFFRANSLHDALYILEKMSLSAIDQVSGLLHLSRPGYSASGGRTLPSAVPLSRLALNVGLAGFLLMAELVQERYGKVGDMLARCPLVVRWAVYEVGILAIALLGEYGAKQFIYFQF